MQHSMARTGAHGMGWHSMAGHVQTGMHHGMGTWKVAWHATWNRTQHGTACSVAGSMAYSMACYLMLRLVVSCHGIPCYAHAWPPCHAGLRLLTEALKAWTEYKANAAGWKNFTPAFEVPGSFQAQVIEHADRAILRVQITNFETLACKFCKKSSQPLNRISALETEFSQTHKVKPRTVMAPKLLAHIEALEAAPADAAAPAASS